MILFPKNWVVDQVCELLGKNIHNKTIAILGVAFKAHTDDVRYSPAYEALECFCTMVLVFKYMIQKQCRIWKYFFLKLYCATLKEAVKNADVLLLLTEWPEFKQANIEEIANLVRHKNIVDARNLWDPTELKKHGFTVRNLARKSSRG